ncbi:MAG: hypothetical protein C5B53_03920 [Candidatus Melainabacteria bacterium]|nr:MAG: hypothetical protein C5B53_03920 [Candidatus Melainabacteria bacterium]
MHPVAAENVSASESKGVSLTIYNQNFGLVKDIREVKLNEGGNFLRFEDVAAKIDPTSVSFLSLTAPNSVTVREQNYQYDLLDPDSILSKSIGKNVKFTQFLPGRTVHELSGTLLNAPLSTVVQPNGVESTRYHGLVVKTANGVVLNPSGQVELAELPSGLISKPSLLWRLDCDKAGTHKSEITYQTGGMNWNCDYVAIINEDDTKTDLTSWVTLSNQSGASFKNAALKLIAGDVHRVQPQAYHMAASEGAFAAKAPQFQEQSFAEYHLYSLKEKTDVNNNETKQLSLFNAADVPTKKRFVFEPTQGVYVPYSGYLDRDKVHVKLEFDNNEENHLGMPWPKGKVRVYKRDKDAALQFIGEDEIDHTPRDEKVRLYIGDAFDVVGERKQTNMRQINDHVRRESYEISLRNHKDSAITVTAVEHTYGPWKIVSSDLPYVKKDSRTFEFSANIPAKGQQTIAYEIELKN